MVKYALHIQYICTGCENLSGTIRSKKNSDKSWFKNNYKFKRYRIFLKGPFTRLFSRSSKQILEAKKIQINLGLKININLRGIEFS
jgi:hypothetical protein